MIWNRGYRYKHKTILELLKDIAKENAIPNWETMKYRELIESTKDYFFDFDFPIYEFNYELIEDFEDKQWKPSIAGAGDFKTKFLKHFINEPICYEDEELFFLALDEALNLIMPYYNQRLQSESWFPLYIKNPSANTDYQETYTRSIEGKTNSDSTNDVTNNSESISKDVTSQDDETKNTSETITSSKSTGSSKTSQDNKVVGNDTPFTALDDTDYASSVTDTNSSVTAENTNNDSSNTNASGSQTSKSTTDSSSNMTSNDTSKSKSNTIGRNTQKETYTFNRLGNIGIQTPGEVFRKTREAFINTCEEIFKDKEIRSLFDFNG